MNDERLERDVRDALLRDDPGPLPPELVSRVRAIPDRSRPPAGRGRSGAWRVLGGLAAVAAVLLLVGALVVGAGLGPAPGPSASPSPAASSPPASPSPSGPSSPAPSPSASPSAAISVGGYTWTRLPADAFGGAAIAATAPLGSGVIAVTSPFGVVVPNGAWAHPTLWRSTDGLAWQPLPDSPAFAGVTDRWIDDVRGLAANGPGLVAVGAEVYGDGSTANAEAWTSTDGVTWTRSVVEGGTDATMDLVYPVAGGFVAIGTDGYIQEAGMQHGTAIWTSTDGRRWTRASTLAGITIDDVAHGAGRYVAVGEDLPARAPVTPIWTSTDGVHFTSVGPTSGVPLDASITHVLWTGSAFVTVGERPTGASVWTSPDGRSWKAGALPVPPGSTDLTATGAVLDGGTLLSVGSHTGAGGAGHGAVWESTDGLDWQVFPLPSAFDGVISLVILPAGPRLIVDGETQDGATRTWVLERAIGAVPTATATASAAPTASPDPADTAAARSLAERFLTAFVADQWSTAYGLLAPQSQQAWGGSVTAFAANWPNPARDTGGHYTIADERYDPTQVATLADGAMSGADLSRSFLFDVTFPNPTGAIPGPYMTLAAAPDANGAWLLWRLR